VCRSLFDFRVDYAGKPDIHFVERQFSASVQRFSIRTYEPRTSTTSSTTEYKCVVRSMATLCMMGSKGIDHFELFLYMV